MNIEDIVRKGEDYDLSSQDIMDITNNQVKITAYSELANVSNLDDIFSAEGNAILLYEVKQGYGHWVALLKKEGFIEFFDSYGLKYDTELNYARYDNTPYLSQLIQKSGAKVVYNDIRLQKFHEDINTCGRWTSLRVVLRDMPLHQFTNLFKLQSGGNDGDYWATALTILYTLKK